MKRTFLFGRFLSVLMLVLLVSVGGAKAQENTFVFEGSASGDFAAVHATTDFSAYGQTALKVCGPLNGDDVTAIRAAIASHFTSLDLSDARITAEGKFVYSGSSYPMKADRIVRSMFAGLGTLQSVVLPGSITDIETYAFQNCTHLAGITIPAAVDTIYGHAFAYCYDLVPEFADGSQLVYIGANAFFSCHNMQQVALPNTVRAIGESAFSSCSALTTINIPSSLTEIPEKLFNNCSKLDDITIPAGIQEIGNNAFYNCASLTSITIPDGVKEIPNAAFSLCKSLVSVTLPATVTSIGNDAFSSCSSLSDITLPANLVKVGNGSFRGCSKLTGVLIPNSVTTIGTSAFNGCSGLTAVTLPPRVTAIPASLFAGCISLEAIMVPAGVTSIGNSVFDGCSSLKSVSLPATVTSVGTNAFQNCTSLQAIDLPVGVKSIPANLFYRCSSLKSVNVAADVTQIGNYAFYECTSLEGFDIPSTVTSIGNYAFSGCTSLVELELSPALTSVGTNAFQNCTSLQTITLPDGVKSIPANLFYRCSSLKSVNVAADVTQIGNSAFYECTSLEGFDMPSTVTSIGNYAFCGCTSLVEFNIPYAVTSIGNQAFRDCVGITALDFPAAITAIPDEVCRGCASLTTVNFPETVIKIGTSSFEGCVSLSEVKLPASLQTINTHAFYNTALREMVLPSAVTSIGTAAFGDCDNLVFFTVNEGCTSITSSSSVWNGCDNLLAIYLPSTITSLHYAAFRGIPNLREVHVRMAGPINPYGGNYPFGIEGCTLYVPKGAVEAYKAHGYWGGNWFAIVEEEYTLASIPDDEWNILKQIPILTGGENWENKWELATTKEECGIPQGVTVSNGHVVSISLAGNNLTGTIPYVVFALPYLSSVNLANNNLKGELGYCADGDGDSAVDVVCDSLRSLDISGNGLTGDLYKVMDFAPNLTVLKASNNRIRDISGILPVYTLEYYGQDLSDIYTVNYSDLYNLMCDPADSGNIPTIFTYTNTDKSTLDSNIDYFGKYFNVNISSNPGDNDAWYMKLVKYVNSSSNVTYYSAASWCDGLYKTPSGSTLYAGVGTTDWSKCHRFNIVMDYGMGDVNFDAELNISDMQRMLNYALDSLYYSRYMPFNFHAANIIDSDNVINVQDVVANINMLLDEGITPKFSKRRYALSTTVEETNVEYEAMLYVRDGQLVLETTRPVAALDIDLSAGNAVWNSNIAAFSRAERGNRSIIYSFFGDTLAEGKTVLADFDGSITEAMVVDVDGNRINLLLGSGYTAVEGEAMNRAMNGIVFDLQGRKVADEVNGSIMPGMYIVNGKKKLLK